VAVILDGRRTAERIEAQLGEKIVSFQKKTGTVPGLAAILVGDNPASASYVKRKEKRAKAVGIHFEAHRFAASVSKQKIKEAIDSLNRSESVHGILVQLPLPQHLDAHQIIDWVSPEKDVDGLTAYNQGLLYRGQNCFAPCTPKGIIRLLSEYHIKLEGKNAVVIGRSELVGRPLAVMLASRKYNATVTIAHTKTKDLAGLTKRADMVVAAIGRPRLLDASFFSQGAIVVDTGINFIADASRSSGRRLVGDVDFGPVSKIASYITPVPGGVGPMTVCMLLENTLQAAQQAFGIG